MLTNPSVQASVKRQNEGAAKTYIRYSQSSYAIERIRNRLVYMRMITAKLVKLTHREKVK